MALLSHRSWVSRFERAEDIVGAPLVLDGESFTVAGVLPEGFFFPTRDVEVWTPLVLPPADAGSVRVSINFAALARLRDGVSREQAQAEADAIVRRRLAGRRAADGTARADRVARVVSLHETMVRDVRPALLTFLVASVGVLAVALTNLAGMRLAQGVARQPELAVRTALGATRRRLVRQLLTESIVLSGVGGALGLLVAAEILELLPVLAPASVPRLDEVRLDPVVLGFNAGLSFVAGLAFGTAPALQWSRQALVATLTEASLGSTGYSAPRARAMLVVAQIALAFVFLVGAGLLLRSFVSLLRVDPGYDAANVLTAELDVPGFRLGFDFSRVTPDLVASHTAATTEFARRLLAELRPLPGVRAATVASSLPFGDGAGRSTLRWEGAPVSSEPGAHPVAEVHAVSPDYLATLRLRLVDGRFFSERDTATSPHVVVVNQALARAVFEGANPIGELLDFGAETPSLVVGVVGDVQYGDLDAASRPPVLYLPYDQLAKSRSLHSSVQVAIRIDGDPVRVVPALRESVASIAPTSPLVGVSTMEARRATSLVGPRFAVLVAGSLAAVAMLLVAIGLYGTLAAAVAHRRREIGVRLALGADRTQIRRMVVRQGTGMVALGLLCGLGLAVGTLRLLDSLLFGVSRSAPATYVVALALLVTVSLLASYLPTRAATRVEPMDALRAK